MGICDALAAQGCKDGGGGGRQQASSKPGSRPAACARLHDICNLYEVSGSSTRPNIATSKSPEQPGVGQPRPPSARSAIPLQMS